MSPTGIFLVAAGAFALGAGVSRALPQAVPDAVTAAPNLYAVAYENDAVRILRVEYAPADRSSMHHHPASCSIIINTQSWESMDPDGDVFPAFADAGMFACEDGYSHSMENIGEEPAGLFVIEVKGVEELP